MNCTKHTKIFLALLLISSVLLTFSGCKEDPVPDETEPPTTTHSITTESTQTAFLGSGLYITDIGKYTGAYVEDGTDEVVTNVMMIVLKNENEQALQLARISLEYDDFTAKFEVTNLPAGESVVLLEKNRHEYTSDWYYSATAENIAFFQEPMSLKEDQVKVTGVKGVITVENLTDQVMGDIYVYYKNSAVDLFYGGITYRVKLDAGLKPGENLSVMSNHYNPSTCTIIDVQILAAE